MSRPLTTALLLPLALTGCISGYTMKGLTGDYEGIVTDFEREGAYATYNSTDEFLTVLWACDAYFQVRERAKFDECIDRLFPILPKQVYAVTDNDYKATFLTYRATLLVETADYEGAARAVAQAHESLRRGRSMELADTSHLATFVRVHKARGIVAALSGDGQTALDAAETISAAVTKQPKGGLDKLTQRTHFDIKTDAVGAIHVALGNYEAAAGVLNREFVADANFTTFADRITSFGLSGAIDSLALDVTKSFRNSQALPSQFAKAKALQETGDIESAARIYDALLATPVISGFSGIYFATLFERGRIDVQQGYRESAIERFRAAIEEIERQRRSVDTEAGRIGFVGDKQAVYWHLVDALIETGNAAEAFEYAERAKARALVDILATKDSFGLPGSERGQRAAALLPRIAENDQRIQQYTRTRFNELMSGERGITFEETVEVNDPQLAALVAVSSLEPGDVQVRLDTGETLIEYYGHDDNLVAFVLSGSSIKAVRLAARNLPERVRQYRNDIVNPRSNAYELTGAGLYEDLLAPVVAAGITRDLVIVPHGALHYLPFAALPGPTGPLIQTYRYRIIPSAAVLPFLQDSSPGPDRMLILGNPDIGRPELSLPFAEQEALAIGSATPTADTVVASRATETIVKNAGGRYSRLHLASHGIFDPQDPLASRLLLAADAENDGSLTVSELYDLDLGIDLVTLSACETGLGEIASGDDVVGFTRGFLFAGATTIISSLWQVDDNATMRLMVDFYQGMAADAPVQALRAAQLALMRGGYRHPYYWAAFQVTGANRI